MPHTYWLHNTNFGRVVYNRKLHPWTEKDIERIVRKYQENLEPEVLLMSDIADRMLFWLSRRLGLDEITYWVARRLVPLFLILQGVETDIRMPRITKEEQDLLDWMTTQAEAVAGSSSSTTEWKDTRAEQLEQLERQLQVMIDWVKQEREGY